LTNIKKILDFTDKFDLFLFDIWGTIHNGVKLFKEVPFIFERLKSLDKKIIFISNSPARAEKVMQVLESMGLSAKLYDFILTSGELVYNKYGSIEAAYFHIGPYTSFKPQLIVENVSEADYLLATDYDDSSKIIDILKEAAKLKKKFLCANPDIWVKIENKKLFCAGYLAAIYEQMGGEVEYFGKPYSPIYKQALSLFSDIKKDRIIAIGDNIDTDIKGANNFGIESLLVTGGTK